MLTESQNARFNGGMNTELRAAIDEAGGLTVVSRRMINVSPQALLNWVSRGVPIDKGAELESALNGIMTRREMFPDDWHRVWPELTAKRAKRVPA